MIGWKCIRSAISSPCHARSISRAIKLLEDELGGEVFRRERPRAILTPLGERMVPLLQQCFDSAQSARMLAESIKAGEAGSLKIAVSKGIDLRLVLPHLNALRETMRRLDYRLMRGSADELVEWLKEGDVELALGDLKDPLWERIDRWKIFDAPFSLVFGRTHRLANREKLTIEDLRGELVLLRTHCDQYAATAELLGTKGLRERLDVSCDNDVFALLESNMGVGLLPNAVTVPETLTRGSIDDLALSHCVSLYAVSGRQRSAVAATFMKMLRAANWSIAV